MTKAKIMVVEDESITARDLQLTLEELGYEVCARVSSGEEAIRQAEAIRPDLALLDIMLAGELDGIETAAQLGGRFAIPVVYLTANANDETVKQAALTGPYGYVIKPFNEKDLRSNIEIALYKAGMERRIRESGERLQRNLRCMIDIVGELIRMRDPNLAGYQDTVISLACAIGEQLGLSPGAIEGLKLSARIRNLGMLSLPAEILTRKHGLTGPLLQLYREHPRTAHGLLKDLDFPWPVAQIVLQHQELLDGSGYPDGLKGDAILLEARILAVADAVAAMSTDQPYRTSRGIEFALDHIEKNRGKLYDPKVADACLRLFREQGYALS